jgi:hypothetical protein
MLHFLLQWVCKTSTFIGYDYNHHDELLLWRFVYHRHLFHSCLLSVRKCNKFCMMQILYNGVLKDIKNLMTLVVVMVICHCYLWWWWRHNVLWMTLTSLWLQLLSFYLHIVDVKISLEFHRYVFSHKPLVLSLLYYKQSDLKTLSLIHNVVMNFKRWTFFFWFLNLESI